MQFERKEREEAHQAPPPLAEIPVAPLVRVKPTSSAPVVSETQRTAPVPKVVPGTWKPWITLLAGPLRLCTVTGLFTATRSVGPPAGPRPPVLYNPSPTRTMEPGSVVTSIAS